MGFCAFVMEMLPIFLRLLSFAFNFDANIKQLTRLIVVVVVVATGQPTGITPYLT